MGGLLMSIGSKDELSEECLLRLAHDKLKADYAELQDNRGVQEHRIMDLQDRFHNLKVDYVELEKQRDDLLNTLNTVIVHYNSLEHEDDPSADYDVESAQRLLTRIKEDE